MDTVKIGNLDVSRFILGSNPFSGFSHQGHDCDRQMVRHFTCERIKAVVRQAEGLGINTIIARADFHMLRVLLEHWDERGTVQWFGQTCPEVGTPERCLERVAGVGAPACHIHGGYADHLLAAGRLDELVPSVQYARKLGLTVGLAGHRPDTFRWAEEHLDVDYYMCSYYNPIERAGSAEHVAGTDEEYLDADREAMTELIQSLSRPVIHYKVLAAGRNDPAEAFAYVASKLRPQDAVCVGVYTGEKPDMLSEDVRLFLDALAARA